MARVGVTDVIGRAEEWRNHHCDSKNISGPVSYGVGK